MSMSRKGTPADNSPIETFHSSLKSETFYLDGIYRTTNAHVIQIVESYIDYYHNIRIQTEIKQPVSGKIPSTGCNVRCFLIVSKMIVSTIFNRKVFCFN